MRSHNSTRSSANTGRKESLTLRIDSDVRSSLEELAAKEHLGPFFLAEEAIRKYVEWDAFAGKFGLVTVSKRLLRTLFDRLTVDEARQLGRHDGSQAGPELVTFWYKQFTLENALMAFEQLFAHYAGAFRYEHKQEGNSHVLVLLHDTGRNSSVYYVAYGRELFRRLGMEVEALVENDSQVTVRLSPMKSAEFTNPAKRVTVTPPKPDRQDSSPPPMP